MSLSIHNQKQNSGAAKELITALETLLNMYKGLEPGVMDLESALDYLSDYAWEGTTGEDENFILTLLHEINSPVELLRGNLIDGGGSDLVSAQTKEHINRVANAAHARCEIDQGHLVNIESLAALARVSERTIRAATNSKNPNAMKITKDGHWTWIEGPEALKWLSERKDFVPTQTYDNRPRSAVLHRELHVGDAWKQWRVSRNLSIQYLASQLGWSDEEAGWYEQIENGVPGEAYIAFSPRSWRQLAEYYGSQESTDVAKITFQSLAAAYANWRVANE